MNIIGSHWIKISSPALEVSGKQGHTRMPKKVVYSREDENVCPQSYPHIHIIPTIGLVIKRPAILDVWSDNTKRPTKKSCFHADKTGGKQLSLSWQT
jgi:hypothetical protein